MTEIITVGEKGQIVIPKKIRNDFNIQKGTKLIIKEEGEKVILKPIKLTETELFMLASEESLKKTWDNKYDSKWDEVL